VLFAFGALALQFVSSAPAFAGGFDARMSTVAGSGALGFRDGNAADATFVLPIGVAVANGTIYVADAGAQRIRIISNGQVRTLAGSGVLPDRGFWVRGGYRDGAGAQAQFDFPAGVAVGVKGIVYVADADNHCIRAIQPDGTVSTFSGSPSHATEVNGPRASAAFHRPMGVAANGRGDVYVADEGVGIRKIAADGTVTTLLKDPGITGVAVSSDERTILGTSMTGGLTYVADGRVYRITSIDKLVGGGEALQPGHPFAGALIDWRRSIYSDAKTGAIRFFDLYLGTSKFLIGDHGSDPGNQVVGYADGPLKDALASDPLGVALDGAGTLYVADSGNRRVRSIAPLNFREATIVAIDALPPEITNAASKNVIVVGNSYVYANSVWDDSWEALLEGRLHAAGRDFTLYPILMGTPTQAVMFDYIENTLSVLPHVDRVIFLMNLGVVNTSGSDWRATYVAGLRKARDVLAQKGIGFSVVVQPTPYDFDWQELPVIRYLLTDSSLCLPVEGAMRQYYVEDPNNCLSRGDASSSTYRDIVSATRESGVSYIDTAPYYLDGARLSVRAPLFGTADGHESDHGRNIMANAMFDFLTAPK
jgi:hypothetical protein